MRAPRMHFRTPPAEFYYAEEARLMPWLASLRFFWLCVGLFTGIVIGVFVRV